MVKGRDILYKLDIVHTLPRKLNTIIDTQLGYAAITILFFRKNHHPKLTSIAGMRSMISYKHTNINQTAQIE